MKIHRTFRVIAAMALLVPGLAGARAVELSPDAAVVTTVSEDARVALKFDLSDLEGQTVRSAYLEWSLSGVSSEDRSEFQLFVPEDSWSDALSVAGLTLAEEPVSLWDIEVQDYERAGGFVRFDVTDAVNAWLNEEMENLGLVIVTTDLSAAALAGQLSNAALVVR